MRLDAQALNVVEVALQTEEGRRALAQAIFTGCEECVANLGGATPHIDDLFAWLSVRGRTAAQVGIELNNGCELLRDPVRFAVAIQSSAWLLDALVTAYRAREPLAYLLDQYDLMRQGV